MNNDLAAKVILIFLMCFVSYWTSYLLFHLPSELAPLILLMWYWIFYLAIARSTHGQTEFITWQGHLLVSFMATFISIVVYLDLGLAFYVLSLGFWHRYHNSHAEG